ncbi:hypothetical protein GFK82_00367 [Candidatus Steffania adelgidicola]|nr:hypothetical protein GFK82_00367 [Candidatus Steffania adelgidicola]
MVLHTNIFYFFADFYWGLIKYRLREYVNERYDLIYQYEYLSIRSTRSKRAMDFLYTVSMTLSMTLSDSVSHFKK